MKKWINNHAGLVANLLLGACVLVLLAEVALTAISIAEGRF